MPNEFCFSCGLSRPDDKPASCSCGKAAWVEANEEEMADIKEAIGIKPLVILPEVKEEEDLPKGWDHEDVALGAYLKFCEQQDGEEMDRLLRVYSDSDQEVRHMINEVLLDLCGYTLSTIVRQAMKDA